MVRLPMPWCGRAVLKKASTRMQPEESVSQNSRQFVHPFLGRHFRRIEKPQHQLSDGVIFDWDCSGGEEVRPGMFGRFLHGSASHTRVPEVLKFEVSIARSASTVIFSESCSIVRRKHLRKPDSLFEFRGGVCKGSHFLGVAKSTAIRLTHAGFSPSSAKPHKHKNRGHFMPPCRTLCFRLPRPDSVQNRRSCCPHTETSLASRPSDKLVNTRFQTWGHVFGISKTAQAGHHPIFFRSAFVSPRRRLDSTRRRFVARERLAFRRRFLAASASCFWPAAPAAASIFAASRRTASALLRACDRESLTRTVSPVGKSRSVTAVETLLTCCPPGPPERQKHFFDLVRLSGRHGMNVWEAAA